jgi:hypothetical protein
MIASTAYLELFLRSITEKALLKTFLRFILMHRHDNDTILDTLLTRISSNSRVSGSVLRACVWMGGCVLSSRASTLLPDGCGQFTQISTSRANTKHTVQLLY